VLALPAKPPGNYALPHPLHPKKRLPEAQRGGYSAAHGSRLAQP